MKLVKACVLVMLLCSVCLAYPPSEKSSPTGIYQEDSKRSFELYNTEKQNESIYDRSYENRDTLERYGQSKWGKEKVPGYVEPKKKTEYFDQYKSQEKRTSKDANRNLVEEEEDVDDDE